jgi:hypothetical protein
MNSTNPIGRPIVQIKDPELRTRLFDQDAQVQNVGGQPRPGFNDGLIDSSEFARLNMSAQAAVISEFSVGQKTSDPKSEQIDLLYRELRTVNVQIEQITQDARGAMFRGRGLQGLGPSEAQKKELLEQLVDTVTSGAPSSDSAREVLRRYLIKELEWVGHRLATLERDARGSMFRTNALTTLEPVRKEKANVMKALVRLNRAEW